MSSAYCYYIYKMGTLMRQSMITILLEGSNPSGTVKISTSIVKRRNFDVDSTLKLPTVKGGVFLLRYFQNNAQPILFYTTSIHLITHLYVKNKEIHNWNQN